MKIKRFYKQTECSQAQSENAILFFAGWGMDERPFLPYCKQGLDYLIGYDYRTLDFDEAFFHSYKSVQVIAWSMGVWAASVVLQNALLPVSQKIAVNGTTTPIDASKGISPAIFQGTLNGLNEQTLRKFQRRCCGNAATYERFLQHEPQRSLDEITEELARIGQQAGEISAGTMRWDKAYIGTLDKIFNKDNQLNAWRGTPCIQLEEEHFSEKIWQTVL